MIDWIACAPPRAIQPPRKNNNCQANGLKYQRTEGEAARFQPKCLAATYTANEPTNISVGLRTISQSAGANVANNRIYSGSTSKLTGLYLNSSACHNSHNGWLMNTAMLNLLKSFGSCSPWEMNPTVAI